MAIRSLEPADVEQVAAINDAGVPGVTPADASEIARLVSLAELALVSVDESEPAGVLGFIIVMAPGVAYESENYRWFERRATNFLYVDRIAVAASARDRGVGAELYRAVIDAATASGREEVTCEVNTRPPNPGSMRFHARLGFAQVGTLATRGGAYEVALLARPIAEEAEAS